MFSLMAAEGKGLKGGWIDNDSLRHGDISNGYQNLHIICILNVIVAGCGMIR